MLVFGRTFRHFVHVINKIFFDVQIPHKAFSNKSDRNGMGFRRQPGPWPKVKRVAVLLARLAFL